MMKTAFDRVAVPAAIAHKWRMNQNIDMDIAFYRSPLKKIRNRQHFLLFFFFRPFILLPVARSHATLTHVEKGYLVKKRYLLGTMAFVVTSVIASGAMAQSLEERIRTLEESMLMGAPGTGFDLQLSGFAHGGFVIQDADPVDGTEDFASTDVKMGEAEIIFEATTLLDNGIEIGGAVQLEGFTDDDQIDETYMWAEGGFGRFVLGAENSADSLMHFSSPWFGLNGVDGASYRYTAITAVRDGTGTDLAGDANKITYFTPRFSGFQFGISYTPNNEDRSGDASGGGAYNKNNGDRTVENIVGVGSNFRRSFGDVSIGASAGWESGSAGKFDLAEFYDGRSILLNVAEDPTNWHIGGEVSMQGFTVGGAYFRAEGYYGTDGKGSVVKASNNGTSVDIEFGDLPAVRFFNTSIQEVYGDIIDARFGEGTSADVASISADASTVSEQNAWTVGATYGTGPWTVGIGYFQAEADVIGVDLETTVIGLGATYDVAPGVSVAADIGFYEDGFADGASTDATGGGILLGINF